MPTQIKSTLKTITPRSSVLVRRFRLTRRMLRQARLLLLSRETVFSEIYQKNKWGAPSSRSGVGSTRSETQLIQAQLALLLKELNVKSMLDAPCGDFNWMSAVALNADYIGADIVADLIENNRKSHAAPNRRFLQLDICHDPLPTVDLIFCRDGLVHLSHADIVRALRNFKASGARYLFTTFFPNCDLNANIATGMWRPLNFCLPAFQFSFAAARGERGFQASCWPRT